MTTLIKNISQAQSVLAVNDIKLVEFSQNIGYDIGLSQMYYDDFITNASGCNEVQKFDGYVVIYGNDVSPTDKHYTEEYLETLDADELIDLLDAIEYYYYDEDDIDDMRYQLSQLCNEDYYEKHYDTVSFYDLEYDHSITGYSKGDINKVKIVGEVEPFINEKYLTSIFYDSPISGAIDITVNGEHFEEINICEFLEDEYAYWDKGDFIKQIDNYLDKDCFYKELLLEYLEDVLEEDLDYSY